MSLPGIATGLRSAWRDGYGLGDLRPDVMAGVILLILGLTRMGRLIRFVPYPVVLGFTAGIAVVIAVLQMPDFLGLETSPLGEHFVDNVAVIAASLPTVALFELGVGLFALVCRLAWNMSEARHFVGTLRSAPPRRRFHPCIGSTRRSGPSSWTCTMCPAWTARPSWH